MIHLLLSHTCAKFWPFFHRDWNSMEIGFRVTIVRNYIAIKCCTCHDSTAVVSCAKFHNDHLKTTWIVVEWNFHPIRTSVEILFVKLWPDRLILWHETTKRILRGSVHEPINSYSNGCIDTIILNTLRPRRNRLHFADDSFKCIFLNENVLISINISLKFIPKGPINNIPELVQIMAWRRPGDKLLS